MKFPVARALAALLLAGLAPLRAQEPAVETKTTDAPPKQPALIDALSAADLDEALSLLRDHFIKPEMLGELPLKRATVQGAIERLAPGAAILQAPAGGEAETSPFRSELLDGRVGYARLGSATGANLAELDAALAKFATQKLGSLVLDLRATTPSSDFEQMADVCRRFVPKGKVLFSVRKANVKQEQVLTSKDDPKFRGVIVALVDRDNAGTAEVIAAVLRAHVNAMVIGQQTRGEAVEFANFPLPGGSLLRIAVAEVALPDKATIFPGGVKPDVTVDVPRETTQSVLKQELEKGVGELVFETERPRPNEASLVAGTNPELEAALAAQKNKAERGKSPPRDEVLQRAVDFITTLAIYEKARPGK
ncbi:MAG TPA: S41 family peptidase [Chthoniobacteraceae bacterium]|nr:S41 family peptidase [Chthoniobacteraceae bacterium]